MTTTPPQNQNEHPTETSDDAIIGVVFRWSIVAALAVGAIVGGILFVNREREAPEEIIDRDPIKAPDQLDQTTVDRQTVRFTDITTAAGIDFVHVSGAQGEKLLPETMGGGCAFLDYDGDLDADLLLVNGTTWSHNTGPTPPLVTLYRNDGTGQFERDTDQPAFESPGTGMGVACGDADGDGDIDVYITTVGLNRYFRNDNGTFVDATIETGTAGTADAWSSSAGFVDFDRDGDLDLFVCNYVVWSRDIDAELNFSLNGTDRAYGPPKLYAGQHPVLYRNESDGTFTDVSDAAGIRVANAATGAPVAKGLAVTFPDLDQDGFPEIIMANDGVQNFVFRNVGDGTFEDYGARSGVAFDSRGDATAAMGIDAADFGNDGRLGIGIGNFANETTSFYVQQRDPWHFVDMAGAEGIGSPSLLRLSFGLFFFDYDLDGRLDMLQANGHLEDEINNIQSSQHYRQPAQLFWNCGTDADACFAAVPDAELGDLARPIVGRGATCADIDGDGDVDVLITQTGATPMLLRNDQSTGHHWLRVRVNDPDAIGTTVELTSNAITQRRVVMPTRSYLSQTEPELTFGLGLHESVDNMTVIWPDGTRQTVAVSEVDATLTVTRPASE